MNAHTQRWLQYARTASARHHRGIAAAIVTLLGGFAVTAFGIAPLAPDAAQIPQRLVTEAVTPADTASQLEALADHPLSLRRSDVTRGTDTAESLLARLGVADASAAAFLRTDATARKLLGRGGKMVQATTTETGELAELVARFPADRTDLAKTHFTRMTIARTAGHWLARLETVPLVAQARLGTGKIRSTLYAATDDAQLPDAIAAQLAEMFSTEIDFRHELRKSDTFSVVYEALLADGEPIAWNEGAGRILAAEFVNNGKPHEAVWFDNDGRGSYYGFDGKSKKHAFLASPLAFTRITSGFALRFHPILQSWRAHLGVDFGAPIGTDVRTVGDGTVAFAGWQNGYGNVVQVEHGGERTTVYAHLSRIEVRKGQHVEQGQSIGAVGMTGWSTGPHLHFEFRLNGKQQDPLQVAKASDATVLDPAARVRFAAVAKTLQAQLQVAETVASAQALAD